LLIKALPRPSLAAAHLVGRSRSTAGWLGLARAAERGQALVTATVVLVLALSGAVFGGVVTRTLNAGEADSASRYGTDALIAGVPFTTGSVNRLRALPGVTLHEVTAFDRGVTDADGSQSQVRFLDVEPGLVPQVPAARTSQGYYPVLATRQAMKEHPGGVFTVAFLHQTITVRIVGPAPTELPGVLRAATNDSQYSAVLMDRTLYAQASGSLAPSAVALDGPVSTAQIESALVGLPTPGLLWVRSEQLASMRADGLARSLSGVFEVCALLSAAFAILVIVLELAGTARERGKTVSFQRTMGLPPRGAAAVTAVQLIPTAVAAVLGGTLLGGTLPWLLGPALDLGSFTEGVDPAIRVDWRITAVLAGGLLLVVAAAAVVEAAVSRGRRLAGVLRLGDGE
jgi:putative ABC transport system permease protein